MGVTFRPYRFDMFMAEAPDGLNEDQISLLKDLYSEISMGWDLVWNTTKDKIILHGSRSSYWTTEYTESLISPLRKNSWYFIRVRGTVNDDHQVKLVNTDSTVSDTDSTVSTEEYTVLDEDFIGSDADEEPTTSDNRSSSGVKR